MGSFKDLTGKKFGRLQVLEIDKEKSTSKTIKWKCICDCGKTLSVASCHLISGHSKSCGCLSRDIVTKSNDIEFDTDLGCLKVYFNNNEYFLCDVEDKDIIEKYCWHKDNFGYAMAWNRGFGGSVKSHRIIMGKYYDITGLVIDHINHNKLDNRKCNLRVCTNAENQRNIRSSSDTNDTRGIYYEKERNKYVLTIRYKGKRNKWRFDSEEQAKIFRDNFYKEHPDDFRYDPDLDYIKINKQDIIHPFTFINKDI